MAVRSSLLIVIAITAPHFGFAQASSDTEQTLEITASSDRELIVPNTPSLEFFLQELEAAFDIAFAYDSRLLSGISAPNMDTRIFREASLEVALEQKGLKLHNLDGRRFAITQSARSIETERSRPAKVNIGDNPSQEVIIVTAKAQVASVNVGAPSMFQIDRAALEIFAVSNPADIIYELPQSVASFTPSNTVLRGAVGGVSFSDLRGFGPERTLVLVNGRRRTLTPGGTTIRAGVDLNAIGEPFLERIEIINQSAGARLGPDAVAGAINFVLRTDLNGVEAGTRFGISEYGDAAEHSLFTLAGSVSRNRKHRIFAGFNYTHDDGLFGGDRGATAEPYGFAINNVQAFGPGSQFTPGFGASRITPAGSLVGAVLANGDVRLLPTPVDRYSITETGGIAPFQGHKDELYNWSHAQHFITPVNRTLGVLDGETELTSTISLFATAMLGATRSRIEAAPLPAHVSQGSDRRIGDAITIDLNDASVSTEVKQFYDSVFGGQAESLILERRFVELGPRIQTLTRRYADIVLGVMVSPADAFELKAEYRYGNSTVNDFRANRVDRQRLDIASNSDTCSLINDCVPINLLRGQEVSQGAADYIRARPNIDRLQISEHEFQGQGILHFNIGDLGPMKTTLGAGFRRASYIRETRQNSPDAIGYFDPNDISGAQNTAHVQASLDAPLMRKTQRMGALELYVAGRLDTGSNLPTRGNMETALVWSPVTSISIFSHYSKGYRPPNVIELYDETKVVQHSYLDPCDPNNGLFRGNVEQNCLAGGRLSTGPNHPQTRLVTELRGYSDPELKPERISSTVIGAELSYSDWLFGVESDIRFSALWTRYRIENMIRGDLNALMQCYESPSLSSFTCGENPETGVALIRREAISNQVAGIDVLVTNLGEFIWDGMDFETTIEMTPTGLGPIDRLWLNAKHNFTQNVRYRDLLHDTDDDLLGDLDNPRHKTLITVGIDAKFLTLAFLINRRGHVRTGNPAIDATYIPAITSLDGVASFDLPGDIDGYFGVKNIANSSPPIAAFSNLGGVFPQYYDIVGRRFSLGLRAKF